jgi:hypothetical protein
MRRKRCKQQQSAMPNLAELEPYIALYRDIADQTYVELAKWLHESLDRIGNNPTFDDRARDAALSGLAVGYARALEVVGEVSKPSRGVSDAIIRHLIAAKRRANLPVQVGVLASKADVSRRRAQDWLHGRETGTVIDNRLAATYERELKKLCQ